MVMPAGVLWRGNAVEGGLLCRGLDLALGCKLLEQMTRFLAGGTGWGGDLRRGDFGGVDRGRRWLRGGALRTEVRAPIGDE